MEANEYDTNRADSDVLLPPRKRLLAGLKRQSSGSASQSSPENCSPTPTPTNEYDSRLQNLLKSYNGSQMSPEEIAKAARTAAVAAAKAAEAARAAAEEKAEIAAKAITAAKAALSLVSSKRNKLKKHVPVQLLYKEQRESDKCGTDEELAQKLHRAINSSPRISKHSPGSKNKHKKQKPNGFPNDDDMQDDISSDGSYEESYVAKVMTGEGESSHSKERVIEPSDANANAMHSNGRKRGRMKQKKLSLSLCSSKDRANPKDDHMQEKSSTATGNAPPSSMEPRANAIVSIEPTPTWKCQDFKAPQCIKPNKVVQS